MGSKPEVGLFIRSRDQGGEAIYEELAANLETLRAESGLDLVDKSPRAEPLPDAIGVYRDRSEFASDDEQLAWLTDAANRFVNVLRPRFEHSCRSS